MLRFCSYRIVFVGDIEKVFLMVYIVEEDKDVFWFLWIDDIDKVKFEVVVLRFVCVVFGVLLSLFLLNVIIKYYID